MGYAAIFPLRIGVPMDFKINKRAGGMLASGESTPIRMRAGSSESEKIDAELSKELKQESKEDLVSFNKEQAPTGDSLVLSNIKKALSVADTALDDIQKTLEQRLYQAREVEAGPYSSRRSSDLNADSYSSYRLEGERIQSTATSNGSNPLSGAGYQLYSSDGTSHDAVSTAAFVLPEADNRSRLSTSTDAASEKDRLEEVISGFRASRAGVAAAINKTDGLSSKPNPESISVNSDRPDAVSSIEEAKSLANQIAQKLGSAYGDEQSAAKLIEASTGKLELNRVKSLLS